MPSSQNQYLRYSSLGAASACGGLIRITADREAPRSQGRKFGSTRINCGGVGPRVGSGRRRVHKWRTARRPPHQGRRGAVRGTRQARQIGRPLPKRPAAKPRGQPRRNDSCRESAPSENGSTITQCRRWRHCVHKILSAARSSSPGPICGRSTRRWRHVRVGHDDADIVQDGAKDLVEMLARFREVLGGDLKDARWGASLRS
jgi:hypothetical protein